MVKKYDITAFGEAFSPITDPVTKFGGQPVWLSGPEWPLSRELGRRMQFVCQISLDPELFGGPPGRLAYLFITGEDDGGWVDGTYDPESGENAIVVQPGGVAGTETAPEPTGPVLCRIEDGPKGRRAAIPCEYSVELAPGQDPGYVNEDEGLGWGDGDLDAYERSLGGNEIGGTPGFIQGDEFPEGGPWRLLLQLDSAEVPFYVNFGDAGVGYAYVSENGRSGKFLWQCY